MSTLYVGRCMAVVGTAWTGPLYCGYRSKGEDANGRPVCGVHKDGQSGIHWNGERGRYPEGPWGRWGFSHGEPRGGR